MKTKDVVVIVLAVVLLIAAAYIGGLRGQASYDRATEQWEETVINNSNQ